MSPEGSFPVRPPLAAIRDNISLSKWVNERFPPWEELLTTREVARLTRRPRWMLLSMTALGRFPVKHRFRGRSIGWLRGNVLDWIAEDLGHQTCRIKGAQSFRLRFANQIDPPSRRTVFCASLRYRTACSARRVRRP